MPVDITDSKGDAGEAFRESETQVRFQKSFAGDTAGV